MRIAIACLTLALAAIPKGIAQPNDAALDRYSDQARAALAAKKWSEAVDALEHLSRLAPEVAQVQANLGLALFFEGRAADALAAFDRARRLNPALPQLDVMTGLCDAELGRYREAVGILAPAFEHPPDEETGRLIGLHLMRSYTELKEPDKAMAVSGRLVERYPNDPEILFQVSKLHADRSYQLMSHLLASAPDSYWAHMANAQVHESLERYDLAQQEYRKAVAMNPNGPGAHYGLGRAILSGSKDPQAVDEAAREFERELALSPANAAAEFELGEIARERGQAERARAYFLKAIHDNPDLFEARIGLARLLLKGGSARDAVVHLMQAARIAPEDAMPHFLLASAYKTLGDTAGAGRELNLYRKLRAAKGTAAEAEESDKR